MIELFKKLFETPTGTQTDTHHRCQLAAAVLLVEVAAIDQNFQPAETTALMQILAGKFQLSETEVSDLESQARQAQATASSLHEYTRVLNEHFSDQEKIELVANMWQVAYADGELDKYEEYIIRRVSELLYVAHSDFIRAKHWAREGQ
ncbi:TerB family tellurite resistance protein [Halioxenophilus sp. WMMB6]|uniref:tellurite resistance TerB family protein n=1 Tax=Halioxenophilus sp. WMMB6 TaxID=3073815 RepID=UPI00295E3184|nr:TerB family tellurite resistance protein [Halioxenophilus sp. WMMB6]